MTDTSSEATPATPAELEQGRVWLTALLWALPALVAVPTVSALLRGHTEGAAPQLIYLLATGVLMWNVWRGSVWSWRITVALTMLTGMLVFMAGLFAGRTIAQGLLVSFAGLAFLGIGLLLVSAGPVRSFLETRWTARSEQLRRKRQA
ncbi:hypothetical protein [Deinococcus sp. Marseille-Q6407]|uniref:hypothetical protein n=1 Tax=Deinococcus sp. Marseille-Q6407 TaxID=2969223 RepID=UPI0021C0D734|nr:hypothetical protein [Deinococcus sp. Marseille-Q6407]